MIGLIAGPVLAVLVHVLLPGEYIDATGQTTALGDKGNLTLMLLIWMAIWWLTEAVELEATALLPVVLLPLLGVNTLAQAAAGFASPLIFLFMGGFLMALSMQRWGLDRRIALVVLRQVGTRPANLIGGFMLATALMSACVSNTATVAMMLPIAMSVVSLLDSESKSKEHRSNFSAALFLGLAYSATIGGLATVIGSPPNGFLVEYAASELGIEISFLRWLAIGLPLATVLLPMCWWLLTHHLYKLPREPLAGGRELIADELKALGPMSRGEWSTFTVFICAVIGWITRPALVELLPNLTDAGIAISAGLLLFAVPVGGKERGFAMDWATAVKLPWGVLILFGGGLSLAGAVAEHGVAGYLASYAIALDGLPVPILVVAVISGMILLTELTSNTASSATIVPILCAMSPTLGLAPMLLAVPATLAASCAFMLPVATPPNAMIFGSGYISIGPMVRAGIRLNALGVVAIGALVLTLEALDLLP